MRSNYIRSVSIMEEEQLLDRFNQKRSAFNINFDPKPEQIKIAKALQSGRYCLDFLPLGFGKTLCFVINSILKEMPSITLVISPLMQRFLLIRHRRCKQVFKKTMTGHLFSDSVLEIKVNRKSRVCHNHKPHPTEAAY